MAVIQKTNNKASKSVITGFSRHGWEDQKLSIVCSYRASRKPAWEALETKQPAINTGNLSGPGGSWFTFSTQEGGGGRQSSVNFRSARSI